MTRRIVAGASMAAALLVGAVLAAEGLESGPQVGQNGRPMPFNPLHTNGPDAGKKVCLV
jgi:hypothetical protein